MNSTNVLFRPIDLIATGDDYYSNNDEPPSEDHTGSLNGDFGSIFGIYCAYIIFSLVIAFLLDKCKVFDRRVHELTLASQENLLPLIRQQAALEGRVSFDEQHIKLEDQCCDCLFGGKNKASREMKKYQLDYLDYLITESPSYMATKPISCTECTDLIICGKNTKIELAPGLYDDFMLYLFNNHSILSMVAAIKGHPFTRAKRRSVFFCQNCITISVFVVREIGRDSYSAPVLLSDYIYMPILMLLIGTFLYHILVCPCLRKQRRETGCRSHMAKCLEALGWTVLLPFSMFCMMFLFVVSFIKNGGDAAALNRIASYAYQTHILAAIEEVLLLWTCFLTGRGSIKFYLCGYPVWSFGSYFAEKMAFGVEIVAVERSPRHNYCMSLFGYETIAEAEFVKDLVSRATFAKELSQSYIQKIGDDIELGKLRVAAATESIVQGISSSIKKPDVQSTSTNPNKNSTLEDTIDVSTESQTPISLHSVDTNPSDDTISQNEVLNALHPPQHE